MSKVYAARTFWERPPLWLWYWATASSGTNASMSHQLHHNNLGRMGCHGFLVESGLLEGTWHSGCRKGLKQPCQGWWNILKELIYAFRSTKSLLAHLDIVSGLCWKHSHKLQIVPLVLHRCKNIATCSSAEICDYSASFTVSVLKLDNFKNVWFQNQSCRMGPEAKRW